MAPGGLPWGKRWRVGCYATAGMRTQKILNAVVVALVVSVSLPAHAIPAFARKYGTSCQTCHTVYPKLTPFGEAFRHNGYRFPGVDSDYWKQDPVALGQEGYKKSFPNSVWPGIAAGGAPLALGFNGQATIHPDKGVTGALADNGTNFTLQDLVGEAHLWAGGSYDDKITYWSEVTFSSDGTISIEKAQVLINDFIGPQHSVNAIIGRGVANVSSFGPHSSYMTDTLMPSVMATGLLGSTTGDSFNIGDNYNFVELNGVVLGGRLMYNVGISDGQHVDVRPTENVYAHLGYKFGGMRFDGEGTAGPTDAEHPWAEDAITLDVFAYKSNSHFVTPTGAKAAAASGGTAVPQMDPALTLGAGLRAQWGSLELNAGFYGEKHNHALDPGSVTTTDGAQIVTQYDELTYVLFPWMVPGLRLEYTHVAPDGQPSVNLVRVVPGVAFLLRPNIKLLLTGDIEAADGAPAGGWGGVNGSIAPATAGSITEFESINIGLYTAW